MDPMGQEKVFVPHAVVNTQRGGRPRQITIAAACNASRHLIINFPADLREESRVSFVIEETKNRKEVIEGFFFPIEDFVINESPTSGKAYSMNGELIAVMSNPLLLGLLSCSIK